jgi:hypothetical protein
MRTTACRVRMYRLSFFYLECDAAHLKMMAATCACVLELVEYACADLFYIYIWCSASAGCDAFPPKYDGSDLRMRTPTARVRMRGFVYFYIWCSVSAGCDAVPPKNDGCDLRMRTPTGRVRMRRFLFYIYIWCSASVECDAVPPKYDGGDLRMRTTAGRVCMRGSFFFIFDALRL